MSGASGAGKTTFMDVVCCRKTSGRITGDVHVNGFPQVQRVQGMCGLGIGVMLPTPGQYLEARN
jgi:ABC-type uncharacterized transport system ATPase subunit